MYGNVKYDTRVTFASSLALQELFDIGYYNLPELDNLLRKFDKETDVNTNDQGTYIMEYTMEVHQQLMNTIMDIDCDKKFQSDKHNDVNTCVTRNHLHQSKYEKFKSQLNWQKYAVTMSGNYLQQHLAHTLLAGPVEYIPGSFPVVQHLLSVFSW